MSRSSLPRTKPTRKALFSPCGSKREEGGGTHPGRTGWQAGLRTAGTAWSTCPARSPPTRPRTAAGAWDRRRPLAGLPTGRHILTLPRVVFSRTSSDCLRFSQEGRRARGLTRGRLGFILEEQSSSDIVDGVTSCSRKVG